MKLTDVFHNGQLKSANTQTAESPAVSTQGALAGRQFQAALVPGQTLQGEVIARDGNQVQIKIAEDFILAARLDANMNLELGKIMNFEVRGNGQTLLLGPLFANMSTQANALKALEMASLPVTQDTVAMTGLMMEAGLPIDKESLQQMFREVNTFPNSNISDIVDLHRLGLAVSEENLTQVSSYKNLTHQLVDGMHAVQNCLGETILSMVTGGNLEGAAKMLQEVLQLVQGGEEGSAGTDGNPVPNGTVQDGNNPGSINNEFHASRDILMLNQSSAVRVFTDALPEVQDGKGTVDADLRQLSQAVENGNFKEQANVLEQILTRGLQDGDMSLLEKVLTHKDTRKILSDAFLKPWTITPEEVADSGKVEEFYNRLNGQLKDLSRILEQNGQSQSTAFKAVSNMSQNVDFLQQLNQAYTYVQLPLRLQNGEAHGDLYVYTNKRNLSAKDGQISALLHLDMEHLGPVDVYVAMQAEHVNTRFYLQDDEMLDFIEQHMDLLTRRLQQRGYNCDFAMQVRGDEEKKSGLKGLLEEKQAQPVAHYAFDVRA